MDQILPAVRGWMEQSWTWLQTTTGIGVLYTSIIRWVMPVLAIAILASSIRSLLRIKYPAEVWGYISLPGGIRIPLSHWENTIGRARSCDIRLDYPTVSRNHSTLIRDDDGQWTITDLSSKSGVFLNGKKVVSSMPVRSGDVISIGGMEIVFLPITQAEQA
ncbi:MAG: FHA domain-containing protein, partial [Lachnospiraceae bacterium]|nr:FHA domain-containing protein [Lachnospiraceae bacterium]